MYLITERSYDSDLKDSGHKDNNNFMFNCPWFRITIP